MTYGLAEAEALLTEIATDLVGLALDDQSRPIHLKLLALKRRVSSWELEPPNAASSEETLETLRAIRERMIELRALSGPRLRSTAPASYRESEFPRKRIAR